MIRSTRNLRPALLAGLVVLLVGCSESEAPAPLRSRPVPTTPPAEYDTAVAKQLFERWRENASETEPSGPLHQGELAEGEWRDFVVVLKGIYCYKVLAVGSDGVSDLDLTLFDDANVPLLRDTEPDARPTLGIAEAICPYDPANYRIRVRAKKGSGRYAMRLFQVSTF